MLNLHRFDSEILKDATDEVRTAQRLTNVPVIYLIVFAEVTEKGSC